MILSFLCTNLPHTHFQLKVTADQATFGYSFKLNPSPYLHDERSNIVFKLWKVETKEVILIELTICSRRILVMFPGGS